jgi:hypothetical protein
LDEYNLELVMELMKRSSRDGWMDGYNKEEVHETHQTDRLAASGWSVEMKEFLGYRCGYSFVPFPAGVQATDWAEVSCCWMRRC